MPATAAPGPPSGPGTDPGTGADVVPKRPPGPTRASDRLRAAARDAAPALLGYAAVRALGLLVLAAVSAVTGEDGGFRLYGRWDSVWYQRIAEDGYGYTVTLPDGAVHSDLAFFPLLPLLERGLSWLVPGLTPGGAGLLVGHLAALAAAWGIYAVGAHLHTRRAGVLLAVLWGVYPTAFVQSMAYTETLFTALAAWSLYAALTRRWLAAGLLCTLAGLTRPTAAALIAALVLTAAHHLWTHRRSPRRERLPWRMLAGACLAPVGWLAYVVFVAAHEGSPTAYFDVQAAWGNSIDFGVSLGRFVLGLPPPGMLGLLAALGLLGWLLLLVVRTRPPLPVLVYTLAVVAVSLIGAGYFGSRPRLMMPAFPLLIPPALALARGPVRRARVTVGVAAVGSAVYGALTLLGSGPP